jgi:hypothetical protein
VDEKALIRLKRDAAARARRLARQMDYAEDRARALKFAAELDDEANAIARTLGASRRGVRRPQKQAQQGPPLKGDKDGS